MRKTKHPFLLEQLAHKMVNNVDTTTLLNIHWENIKWKLTCPWPCAAYAVGQWCLEQAQGWVYALAGIWAEPPAALPPPWLAVQRPDCCPPQSIQRYRMLHATLHSSPVVPLQFGGSLSHCNRQVVFSETIHSVFIIS